jgi:sugar phosphate isomerase/epimerase
MDIGVVGSSMGRYTFTGFLDATRDMGAQCMELPANRSFFQGTLTFDDPAAVRREIEARGLYVYAIGGGCDFVQPTPEGMEAQVTEVQRQIDLTVAFGCDVVRTFGGEPKEGVPAHEFPDRLIEGYRAVIPYAEKNGVYLAMENHGWITNDADVALRIVKAVDSERMRLTVDTSNYRWFGLDLDAIAEYYRKVAPYVIHTHLKDGSAERGKMGDYIALALGEGEVDLPLMLRLLRENGYDRALCIEYEGAEDAQVGMAKGVDYLKRWAAQAAG